MLRWKTWKKGLVFALAACLTLGSLNAMAQTAELPDYQEATEETQEQMAELFRANSIRNILQGRTAITRKLVFYKDGKSVAKYYNYGDPDNFITEDTTGFSLLVQPTLYLTVENGKMREYLLAVDDYEEEFWNCFSYLSLRKERGEEAVAVAEDDESIYLVAETQDPEVVQDYMDIVNEYQEGCYSPEDGVALRFYMIFDRDDSKLLRTEIYLLDEEGKEKLFAREERTYDQLRSVADTLFAKYFEAETRNIIIVTAPGTDNETPMGYTVPVGVSFDICFDGEYPEVYTDEACTKPLDFSKTAELGDCYLYIPGEGSSSGFGM